MEAFNFRCAGRVLPAAGLVLLAAATARADITFPDPMIVWTDAGTGKVQVTNPDPYQPVTDIVSGQMTRPTGVAWNPSTGALHISDSVEGKIYQVRLDGTGLYATTGGLSSPTDLVRHTDPDPFIVWTDSALGKVQERDPEWTPISVNYATADGTAVAGSDYTGTSGTLTWAAGEVWPKSFQVPILDDQDVEPSEDFWVSLNTPVGGTIGAPGTAGVRIFDNDGGTNTPPEVVPVDTPGTFRFPSTWSQVDEGAGTQTVTVYPASTPPEDMVISGLTTPTGIVSATDTDYLFIADVGTDALYYVDTNPDPMTPVALLAGLSDPTDLVYGIDPSPYIVWTDRGSGTVKAAWLSYTSPPSVDSVWDVIGPGLIADPFGLAYDPETEYLYITDRADGKIWRSFMDGTGLEVVVDGLVNPEYITFVPEPSALMLLGVGGLAMLRRRRQP